MNSKPAMKRVWLVAKFVLAGLVVCSASATDVPRRKPTAAHAWRNARRRRVRRVRPVPAVSGPLNFDETLLIDSRTAGSTSLPGRGHHHDQRGWPPDGGRAASSRAATSRRVSRQINGGAHHHHGERQRRHQRGLDHPLERVLGRRDLASRPPVAAAITMRRPGRVGGRAHGYRRRSGARAAGPSTSRRAAC